MTDLIYPSVDFSTLGSLGDIYRQSQQQAQRDQALQQWTKNSSALDPNLRALIAADPQTGIALATLTQKDAQRQSALKLSEGFGGLFGGQPQAQPAPAQESPASTDPRGIRNNNPLNIEAGPFTQGQPGYQGSDGRFARFEQPQQGVDAAGKLLDTYQSKYGLNTIRGIINRWAPAGDKNDTNGYVASVAGRMGVDPDQPLTPEQRQPLIAAMGQFENGRPIQTGQASLPPNATPTQGYAVPGQQSGGPQAPQATLGGKPMDQWLPMMMRLATHPDAPPEVQKVAIEFVKAAQAEAGLTPKQKDYRTYVQQERAAGKTPMSFNDFDQQGKQTEGEKALEKGGAETFLDIQKQGRDSRSTVGTLQILDKLTRDPRFYSGSGGSYVTQLKRLGASLGIATSDAATPNELFEKMANKLVVDTAGGSLGTGFSNADRDFMQRTVANIGNTPEGNRAILQMALAVEQRKQELAQVSRDYVKKNGGKVDAGLDQVLSDYADKNPLFGGPKSGSYSGAGDWQDAAQAPANPIGAAQGQQGAISDGATATNKATGQKIIFKGGQWVPAGPST